MDGASVSTDNNVITFPLSSEEPYSRFYWKYDRELNEVLSHANDAVDLEWLNSGNAPVLDSHNAYDLRDQIGVVTKAWLDNNRVYVSVKFSNRADAQAFAQDIRDGIIRNVSVGYEISAYEVDEENSTFIATRWTPKEASFVPLPADQTVGIGRAYTTTGDISMSDVKQAMPGMEQETDDQRAERLSEVTSEIIALAKSHNQASMANDYIRSCVTRGEVPSLPFAKGMIALQLEPGTPLVSNEIGMNEKERQSFSLLNYMRALDDNTYTGAGFEQEAVEAANQKDRSGSRAATLPEDIMNSWGSFTVDGRSYRATDPVLMARAAMATSGNANVLTVDHMAERFIDNLRNQSSILQAGATVMEGLSSNVEIPGGDQNIAAAWLAAEDANAAESVPTFRKITLSPKDVAAYTDVTRRMLQQSTIAMEAYIRAQLTEAHRIAIDYAGIYGAGSSGVPEGIVNTTGIGAVDFATANTPTRSEMIDIATAVAVTNRGRNVTHLGNSNMVGTLQKTQVEPGAATGQFLMNDAADSVVGRRFIESNQILDTDVVSGVWSDFIFGMWGGLQLDVSDEAKFLSGGRRFRSIQTVDTAVTRVGSFVLGRLVV
jgi:HK97 family phage major capsid protein